LEQKANTLVLLYRNTPILYDEEETPAAATESVMTQERDAAGRFGEA